MLPVKHRITVKTAVLTHKVLTTFTPPYLHDMLTVAAPAGPMRSAGAPLLFVPRVRTELARPAFSVAGLTVFNSLTSYNQTAPFYRHFQAPPKDSSFYNALVCPPPSASVSKDTIGAIQMLLFSFFSFIKHANKILFFVITKCQISTIIMSLDIKLSMYDLISDVNYCS